MTPKTLIAKAVKWLIREGLVEPREWMNREGDWEWEPDVDYTAQVHEMAEAIRNDPEGCWDAPIDPEEARDVGALPMVLAPGVLMSDGKSWPPTPPRDYLKTHGMYRPFKQPPREAKEKGQSNATV